MRLQFNEYSNGLQSVFGEANKYANFSKLCIDTVNGKLEAGVTFAKANENIGRQIRKIYGLPEHPTDREVRNALRSKEKNTIVFEILEDTIEDTLVSGWNESAFFRTLVETKNNRLGQKNSFYIPDKTIITISKINNGHHDMIRQRLGEGTERSVETSSIGAKIYMSLSRYLQGVESWVDLIQKISEALSRYVDTMMHTAFVSAGQSLPETQWYSGGAMEAASHDEFVKLIQDVELATNSTAMIVGTKVALSQLRKLGDVQWISEDAKNDVYRMGRIGTFEGTQLVELPQAFALNDTTKYLEEDKYIYIFPNNMDKPIKFYWEGDTEITEVTDSAARQDKSMDYEVQATCGCEVITNRRFGTWVIS